MNKFTVFNSGCVVEDAMKFKLIDEGISAGFEYSENAEETDYMIYVSCRGTGEVIKMVYDDIRYFYSIKKEEAKLIVTGCFATEGHILRDYCSKCEDIIVVEKKDWVIPVLNLMTGLHRKTTEKIKLDSKKLSLSMTSDVAIKFMIEDGCANKCSFCKVHYSNDPGVKSVPKDKVIKYLKDKIKSGTRAITLGGENTTLYGIDLYRDRCLHEVIHELSLEEDLVYINVTELMVSNMYPELFAELLNNPKVKTIEFQLESSSDKILKLMNRGYTLEEYDYYVKKLKEAGKYVSTVLMSGFPYETYEDLDYTASYLKERGIFCSLICQYDDFFLVPSSHLPQLSPQVKKAHTRYLLKQIRENNHQIIVGDMDTLTETILTATDGYYHIFTCANSYNIGLSSRKEFDDMEPGTVLQMRPKGIIKKSKKAGMNHAYRY